ncbi:MAG TPA: O-antigen ligase family protein [Kofleriaceae bacterium]|nr:O-antigen ligase family protein [Kofleriaceae bacterium]
MRFRDRIAYGLAALALLVSVLVIGGAQRGTQAMVAVLVAGALATQVFARRRLDRMSPLVVLLGIALGLTALQLIPLPDAIREALNPHGEALRADGAALTHTTPWGSLSLDPAGTMRALTFFLILIGIAVVALRFAASEKGRFALLAAVAATCGLAALVTGIHTILNLDALYGVYEPLHASPPVLSPLLNSNHMGSLMALGAVLSVGLAFYTRQNVRLRVLWIFNALGCLLVMLATLSRGAVLAFAFGFAVTGAALIAQKLDSKQQASHGHGGRRRRINPLTSQLPIAIIIAFGLGLVVYSSAGKVASQLDNTSLTELSQPSSKYAAWKSSIKLVKESPWVGIGRGAFEPTFTRVHDPAAYVTFSHLENEYLQAVVEWGIVGALALAAAFGWCLMRAFRRWRDGPLAAAAIGAVAGVLLQSTVDFGIELLGVAVPMTIVAATLLVVPLRETSNSSHSRVLWGGFAGLVLVGAIFALQPEARSIGFALLFASALVIPMRKAPPMLRTVVLRFVLIASIVAGALLVLLPDARSVQEDHDALLDGNPSLADVHEVIERHPLDYFGYGHAAGQMMNTNDPRAASYLNHALVLHPTHPGLHRLAARVLVATGRRDQAAVQYSLALEGTLAPAKLLLEIVTLLPNVDQAAAAIPTDLENSELIYKALKDMKRDDIMLRWLARSIVRPSVNTEKTDRMYDLAMEKKEYGFAERAAQARLKIARTTTSRLKLAQVHAKQGKQDVILAELSDVAGWRGRLDEKADAWLLVCDVKIDRKQWDPAVECIHRLEGSGALTAGKRDETNKRLTFIKEQRTLEARQQAIEALERNLRESIKTPTPTP